MGSTSTSGPAQAAYGGSAGNRGRRRLSSWDSLHTNVTIRSMVPRCKWNAVCFVAVNSLQGHRVVDACCRSRYHRGYEHIGTGTCSSARWRVWFWSISLPASNWSSWCSTGPGSMRTGISTRSLPACRRLALVAAWFAVRRRRETVQLSVRLQHNVAQLQEEVRRRRELQEQLREAYKVAAVGTVAGGLAHELNDVLQPIVTLSQLARRAARRLPPRCVPGCGTSRTPPNADGKSSGIRSPSPPAATRDTEEVVPARSGLPASWRGPASRSAPDGSNDRPPGSATAPVRCG